jgi:hypothetical protein
VSGPASLAVRLLRQERALWTALARLVTRRPDVPPGAAVLRYDGAGRPMSLTLLGLSALELVAVEIAVPWHAARTVLLVLGVWSLALVAGLVAGTVVRPHVVTAEAVRLRSGGSLEVAVPLARVAAVRARRHDAPGRTLAVAGEVLALAVAGQTTVEVDLDGPVALAVPGRTVPVRTVRFAADDAAGAVRAIIAARDTALPAGRDDVAGR